MTEVHGDVVRATHFVVLAGGEGQCCTGNTTNCSPVSIDMQEEELSYSGSDLALAFGLTSGAGACTALGVATVYFVEILAEAVEQFSHRFENAAVARTMSALSFF